MDVQWLLVLALCFAMFGVYMVLSEICDRLNRGAEIMEEIHERLSHHSDRITDLEDGDSSGGDL